LQASISIIMLAMAGVLAAIALNLRGEVDVTALTVVAIVLGLGSSGLLTLALFARRDYLRARTASGIVPGRLIATDLAGTAPLLNDPEWGLTGRPDYILQTKDGQVPVEVKTGHTPKHAYRSHRLQVACYLRLLESTGKKPEYGMVSYPDGVFRVAWDDALRQDLRTTLDRMQAAKKEGRADRDHDQAARCRGCARREACTQKLGP
jgi:CRISPR-associated exonuclease Cas4